MAKRFTSDMLILDALELHEGAAEVFKSFGLPCDVCVVAEVENIGEGARSKGIDPAILLTKLNALFDAKAADHKSDANEL
jgi:hybrid cluster-associated redox disulfide protein